MFERSSLNVVINRFAFALVVSLVCMASMHSKAIADTTTWDRKYSTAKIEVTVVYFLPSDRVELPDWRQRVDYFCSRIESFHEREFGEQSKLSTKVIAAPFRSKKSIEQLRAGDADFIFFRTLEEVDRELKFEREKDGAFPILLILSDINWKPLDDFYRLKPTNDGLQFEGSYDRGRHFPGAESGGARATYLDRRGIGWGLVSADGWRVPYSGSDCVVYHEGVGHTIGLPHPNDANNSVMSVGQYHGWINESFVDPSQKKRIGWKQDSTTRDDSLFSQFRALPEPAVPQPKQPISLVCDWPSNTKLLSLQVQIQTDLFGPWTSIPIDISANSFAPPNSIAIGTMDRATPVSYRVNAVTKDQQQVELWGYFQVRENEGTPPTPSIRVADLATIPRVKNSKVAESIEARWELGPEMDLLRDIDVKKHGVSGDWQREEGSLLSPKQYGARIELPATIPEEYQLNVIVEPLDEPNALTLGQRSGSNRFLVLLNYQADGTTKNAIENIDGSNVGNETTNSIKVFEKNRTSQVICTVHKNGVETTVDGVRVINWKGDPSQLSLSEYWATPNPEHLFIGAYDCRYRILRATLRPIAMSR